MHGTSGRAHKLFEFNKWQADSKSVTQSCITQYGLINYTVISLDKVFNDLDNICQKRLLEYPFNLKEDKWDFARCAFFIENPIIHLYTQAFLAEVKTFLDLVIQLVCTEKVVSAGLNGFHEKGERVLNVLTNNVVSGRNRSASRLIKLITDHKGIWIDQFIDFRDGLIHLPRGMMQIMVSVELEDINSKVSIKSVTRPSVNGMNFNDFAHLILNKLDLFTKEMISILKGD